MRPLPGVEDVNPINLANGGSAIFFRINGKKPTSNNLSVEAINAATKPVHQTCRLLQLSFEIRSLIYDNLLVSKLPIANAHTFLDDDDTVDTNTNRFKALDAQVSRTYRTTYKKALPILYSKNTFYLIMLRHVNLRRGPGKDNPCF